MSEKNPNNEERPQKKSNLTLVSLAAAVGGVGAALAVEGVRVDGEKSEEPAISSVPSAPLASGNPQNMETVIVELDGEKVARLEVPKSESGIDDE